VNGKCANRELSQRRGSPHPAVPELCQNSIYSVHWGLASSEKQMPQAVENTEKRQ